MLGLTLAVACAVTDTDASGVMCEAQGRLGHAAAGRALPWVVRVSTCTVGSGDAERAVWRETDRGPPIMRPAWTREVLSERTVARDQAGMVYLPVVFSGNWQRRSVQANLPLVWFSFKELETEVNKTKTLAGITDLVKWWKLATLISVSTSFIKSWGQPPPQRCFTMAARPVDLKLNDHVNVGTTVARFPRSARIFSTVYIRW